MPVNGIKSTTDGGSKPVVISSDVAPRDQQMIAPLTTVPASAMFMGAAYKDVVTLARTTWLQAPSLISIPLSATSGTVVANVPLYGDVMNDAAKFLMILHNRFMGSIKYRITLFGASTIVGGLELGWMVKYKATPTVNDLRIIKGETIPANNCSVFSFEIGPIVPDDGIMRNFFLSGNGGAFHDPSISNDTWASYPHFVIIQNVPLQATITAESLGSLYMRVETMLGDDFMFALTEFSRVSAAKSLLLSTSSTRLLASQTSSTFSELISKPLSYIFQQPQMYLSFDGYYNIQDFSPMINSTRTQITKHTQTMHLWWNGHQFYNLDSSDHITLIQHVGSDFQYRCSIGRRSYPAAYFDFRLTMADLQPRNNFSFMDDKVTMYGFYILNYDGENQIRMTDLKIDAVHMATLTYSYDKFEYLLSIIPNHTEFVIQYLEGVTPLKILSISLDDSFNIEPELNDTPMPFKWRRVRELNNISNVPVEVHTRGVQVSNGSTSVFLIPYKIDFGSGVLEIASSSSNTTVNTQPQVLSSLTVNFQYDQQISVSDFSFSYGSFGRSPLFNLFSKVPERAHRVVFTRLIPPAVTAGYAVDGLPTVSTFQPALFPQLNEGEVLLFNLVTPNNNQTLFTVCWTPEYKTFYVVPAASLGLYGVYNTHDMHNLLFTNPVVSTKGNLPRQSIATDFLDRVVALNANDSLMLQEKNGPNITTIKRSLLAKLIK